MAALPNWSNTLAFGTCVQSRIQQPKGLSREMLRDIEFRLAEETQQL